MSGNQEPAKYRVVCSDDLPFMGQWSGFPDRDFQKHIRDILDFITENPKTYSFNISGDYDLQEYYVYIGARVAVYYFIIGQIVVPFFTRRLV